jgi:hypothetical protein
MAGPTIYIQSWKQLAIQFPHQKLNGLYKMVAMAIWKPDNFGPIFKPCLENWLLTLGHFWTIG